MKISFYPKRMYRLDMYRHQHNLNIFCLGGSGSSQVQIILYSFAAQWKYQFIASDPKGELLRSTGGALEKMGYDVKVAELD
jgi:type IV secretion system protein VirD4